MIDASLPYLLVAEQSLLPVMGLVVQSVEKHGDPSAIHLVVPGRQVDSFRQRIGVGRAIHAEEDVLPEWPLSRIRSFLPRFPGRAGWYLQQFLKLQFGEHASLPHYVIWDADTVMLRKPLYGHQGRFLFNTAREHHPPYFDTYRRLFGAEPPLHRSVISQYMLIDTQLSGKMKAFIEQRRGLPWVDAVMRQLPGLDPSEFSEFETYANFVAWQCPSAVELCKLRWFRYGAQIVEPSPNLTVAKLEKIFRHYHLVAFERHPSSVKRTIAARLLHSLRVGS